jgi:hypothetical protein
MVKLNKRPEPPKPIRSEKDYRENPNLAAINEDCYSKCYICEDKSTTINIEHLVPHRGDPKLNYEWSNLFLSCGHCNNTKEHGGYERILDPSKVDPEDYISLSFADSLIEKVVVEALTGDEDVVQTAELLERVYNGGTTDIKEIECAHLRNKISASVARFIQYIKDYREEPDIGYDAIIKKEISRSSEFAAFKRGIIRNDAELTVRFAEALI